MIQCDRRSSNSLTVLSTVLAEEIRDIIKDFGTLRRRYLGYSLGIVYQLDDVLTHANVAPLMPAVQRALLSPSPMKDAQRLDVLLNTMLYFWKTNHLLISYDNFHRIAYERLKLLSTALILANEENQLESLLHEYYLKLFESRSAEAVPANRAFRRFVFESPYVFDLDKTAS